MYDLESGSDTKREWIEVYNMSTNSLILSEWSVFEQGKKHAIQSKQGGGILAPQSYAVIADDPEKFMIDHPAYSGELFESTFSLNNKGEEIALRDPLGNTHSSVLYNPILGGNGTGDSLQRSPGGESFVALVPTPGSGIPEGGLQKSTPAKSKSVARSNTLSHVTDARIVGDSSQVALAGFTLAEETSGTLWWLAPLLVALFSTLGVTWSGMLKKEEWTIIDDGSEKG